MATDTCPRRHALRAPWVHAAFVAYAAHGDAAIGMTAPAALLDAIVTIRGARAYRSERDREAREAEARARREVEVRRGR